MSDIINTTVYDALTNVTDPFELTVYVNNQTGGLFYLLFTLSLAIIIFMALMKKEGPIPAAVASCFVVGITGILLVLTGAIDASWLGYYIIPVPIIGAAAFINSRK